MTTNTRVAAVSGGKVGMSLIESLAGTVLTRCDALAACTCEAGSIHRAFLSPAMADCNTMTAEWMEAAGMRVNLDEAGNLRGVYDGDHAKAPRLIIGSHLDTVPSAGRYDGVLGVMLGIALVESLDGRRLPFAIEVIGFSDEEGVRFGFPFIGSRATVGMLDATHLELLDAHGVSLGAALDAFRRLHANAISAELAPRSSAYLEFHIEQGPVLDKAQQSLAAVTAIIGQSRATLTFRGEAGHAGTTPMALRHDAMMAAAEWMLMVESTARATPNMVATTGRVECAPGATNIIPGSVTCSLDLRTANDTLRETTFREMLETAAMTGARRGVRVRQTIEVEQASVSLYQSLTDLAQHCIASAGVPSIAMVSGAGHDAMILAPHLPTAMIFLRSPGGISHNPAEAVLAEDVGKALQAGRQFLAEFPDWLKENGVEL